MEKYKVLLYPKAFRDIDSIYAYIALEKLAPENAKSQTDRIWSAIEALDSFPSSHQDRQVGKYTGKGYKQLLIDHYVAIFKIDEPSKTVYVVTVQRQHPPFSQSHALKMPWLFSYLSHILRRLDDSAVTSCCLFSVFDTCADKGFMIYLDSQR